MTSILISSDDPQISEDLAQQLAAKEGYTYLGGSLLKEIAEQRGVSEEELLAVLEGVGGRKLPKQQRNRLLCHIQAATLEALAQDNVACVGLAAHLYVQNVSHILHLRVLANPDTRLQETADRKAISLKKAKKLLEKERLARIRWSTESFGINEYEPALYDIVVQLKQISAERVLQIVRDTAKFRGFATMTYSRKCLGDLVLASKVREALLPSFPDIRVKADGDRVIVNVKCAKRKKLQTVSEIKELAGTVKKVGLVEVHAVSSLRDLDEGAPREPRAFLNGE